MADMMRPPTSPYSLYCSFSPPFNFPSFSPSLYPPPPSLPPSLPSCSQRKDVSHTKQEAEVTENPEHAEHYDNSAELLANDRYKQPSEHSSGALYDSVGTTLNQAYGANLELLSKDASYRPQLPPPRNSISKRPAVATPTSPAGGVKNPVYGAPRVSSNRTSTDKYGYVQVEPGKE